jgi:hypothetical protein
MSGGDRYGIGIGQCVGAQNQKFFFVFVAWNAFFCLWTFSTLLALNVRAATRRGISLDPEQIVMIALYALAPLPVPTTRILQGRQIGTILYVHGGNGVDTYRAHWHESDDS